MFKHKIQNARRRGQAVVEFALVLPLLLLLVFGAIEFGRVLLRLHLLTTAAREAARVGSLPNNVEADVQDKVDDVLEAAGMESGSWSVETAVSDPDGVERTGGLTDAQQGDRVQVAVTNHFEVLTGSIVPGLSGTIPLTSTCVFRHE